MWYKATTDCGENQPHHENIFYSIEYQMIKDEIRLGRFLLARWDAKNFLL